MGGEVGCVLLCLLVNRVGAPDKAAVGKAVVIWKQRFARVLHNNGGHELERRGDTKGRDRVVAVSMAVARRFNPAGEGLKISRAKEE